VSFSWTIKPNTVSTANYNGIQPPTLFFENSGDYIIELIGDNGSCKDTVSKTLFVTKLLPNAGKDTFYCGNMLQYQLGESPIRGFKYAWSPSTGLNNPSQSNPILSIANEKRDYILQLEDTLSGCRFYDTVKVSAFNLKNFTKIIDTLICNRDSISISLPNFTKSASWHNAINISDSTSKQPILFPKDTQTFIVHFEDSNRCKYQDTFHIFTKICCEHLPHFLVSKNTLCFGENLQITENSTFKTPVNHKWKVIPNTVSPSFSTGKTPPNFQFSDSGRYEIWLTIYDSFCKDSFNRTIQVVRVYPNAGIDQSSCRLQNTFSIGMPPIDGYQYVWSPEKNLSNPYTANPSATLYRDSIHYILETTHTASRCVFNHAVAIQTKINIDSAITLDTLCHQEMLNFHGRNLNISGFYDTILPDQINTCDSAYRATSLYIFPRKDTLWPIQYGCKRLQYKNTLFNQDTVVFDSIYNQKGCLVSVMQIPITILNTTFEDSLIEACGSYLHNGIWLNESYKRIRSSKVPFYRKPTCDSIWRNIGLEILQKPNASIETNIKERPVPYGSEVILEGKDGDYYQWNFENSTSKSIVYKAFQDFRFTLIVSNQNNCKDTANFLLKVGEIPNGSVVFPNAFSPNGDQINDYFKPNSYQYGTLVSMSIFNRWGEKIFEQYQEDTYWDGSYKNEIQPSGVYIYIATFKSPKGELKTIKGDFLLVR
jgi:gliding motility-associated-like protein